MTEWQPVQKIQFSDYLVIREPASESDAWLAAAEALGDNEVLRLMKFEALDVAVFEVFTLRPTFLERRGPGLVRPK